MPIAILSARQPSRPLPSENRLDALFPEGRDRFDFGLPVKAESGAWGAFFRGADRALHGLQKLGRSLGWGLQREAAIRHVVEWIIRHQDADGAWGGIQPPWICALMALHVEGYALDHPVMAKALAALDHPSWRVDRGEATWLQATNSPVWDTMLTGARLAQNGLQGQIPAAGATRTGRLEPGRPLGALRVETLKERESAAALTQHPPRHLPRIS
jgi:squalene-hopene/tetraprenyl-beta-curcumene cyclase